MEFVPRAAAELERRRAQRKDEDLAARRGEPDHRERHERRLLLEKASGYEPARLMMRIRLELARPARSARREAIREMLETLARGARKDLSWTSFLAEGFAALRDYDRAFTFTRRLLRADRENAPGLALEARLYQAQGKHEDAVRRAIDSLALVYVQPALHCLLGRSLIHLREWQRAEEAFRVALAQAPGLPRAYEGLSQVLRRDRTRLGEAGLYMALASQARRKKAAEASPAPGPVEIATPTAAAPVDRSRVVTIVSGLPRSGTSMMMQMLAAAGLSPYTDGKRQADSDNPRGYLEHENATRLHKDTSWLPEARGKVVKVVAQLLPYLPPGEEYRIIFMHRALHEITASQSAMLDRLRTAGANLTPRQLDRIYSSQLVRIHEWLRRAPGVHVLPVQYGETLENPRAAADRLAAFLGEPFDHKPAAESVAPAMRRQR